MLNRPFHAFGVRRRAVIAIAAASIWAALGCRDATRPGWQKLHFESGLADTPYQRTISLSVSTTGVSDVRGIDLVIDPGTPSERRANGVNQCPSGEIRTGCDWWIDVADTVAKRVTTLGVWLESRSVLD